MKRTIVPVPQYVNVDRGELSPYILRVRWTTDYAGETYSYVEVGSRARLLRGDTVLWWGDPAAGIPPGKAPLVVVLAFSIWRKLP